MNLRKRSSSECEPRGSLNDSSESNLWKLCCGHQCRETLIFRLRSPKWRADVEIPWKLKNDVFMTAVELNIIFWNESSILVSVVIRENREIIRNFSEYFRERAFLQSRTLFLQMSSSYSRGKRIMSFRECNVDDAGLSREWRPEGAPTTDSHLHFLLDTKELPVVLFSVIVVSLQKKIPK